MLKIKTYDSLKPIKNYGNFPIDPKTQTSMNHKLFTEQNNTVKTRAKDRIKSNNDNRIKNNDKLNECSKQTRDIENLKPKNLNLNNKIIMNNQEYTTITKLIDLNNINNTHISLKNSNREVNKDSFNDNDNNNHSGTQYFNYHLDIKTYILELFYCCLSNNSREQYNKKEKIVDLINKETDLILILKKLIQHEFIFNQFSLSTCNKDLFKDNLLLNKRNLFNLGYHKECLERMNI